MLFLYDGFAHGAIADSETVLRFASANEAQTYLDYAVTDGAATLQLRDILYRSGQWPAVYSYTHQRVLYALAQQLEAGFLKLAQSTPVASRGGWPMAASTTSAAATASGAAGPGSGSGSGASSSSSLISLSSMAPKLPAPPLLPILQTVQIEGAEVLPEIMQTLNNVKLAIGSIDLASLSLAPAPSKVPQIQTAMTDASTAITTALGDL